MIDVLNIKNYKENNRIEAKKAQGGLPRSIWETYSAFANTMGGVIVLGVEELKDHTLKAVGVNCAKKMLKEFWEIIKDKEKVSVNILKKENVVVKKVDNDKDVIVISVPKASRADRPIFIGLSAFGGSYRRNGEGDYRCKNEEVYAMIRDANKKTHDMTVLENTPMTALSAHAINRYRLRYFIKNGASENTAVSTNEFLFNIGGADFSNDNKLHPTKAGLLLFGKVKEILKIYPNYKLVYVEKLSKTKQYKFCTGDKRFSGNVFDFFNKAQKRISILKASDVDMKKALLEALTNCVVNADYNESGGVKIIIDDKKATFINTGGFRIDVEVAKMGGVSDSRNGGLVKMLNAVGVGAGQGLGLSGIFRTWQIKGLDLPTITEKFSPDSITVKLPFIKSAKNRQNKKILSPTKKAVFKGVIISYITENISCDILELKKAVGATEKDVVKILTELISQEIVVKDGNNYKLKR